MAVRLCQAPLERHGSTAILRPGARQSPPCRSYGELDGFVGLPCYNMPLLPELGEAARRLLKIRVTSKPVLRAPSLAKRSSGAIACGIARENKMRALIVGGVEDDMHVLLSIMTWSAPKLKSLCRPWRGLNGPVMAVLPSVETLGYSRDVPPGQICPFATKRLRFVPEGHHENSPAIYRWVWSLDIFG